MSSLSCENITSSGLPATTGPVLLGLSLTCLVGGSFFFPGCLIYFCRKRSVSERLFRRNLFLLIMSWFGFIITTLNFSVRNIVGARDYNCSLFFILVSVSVTLLLFAPVFRLRGLYQRVKFNQCILKSTFANLQKGELIFKLGEETFKKSRRELREKSVPFAEDILRLDSGKQDGTEINSVEDIPRWSKQAQNVLYSLFCWKTHPDIPENLQLNFFLSSDRFINGSFLLTTIAVVSFLLVTFSTVYPVGEGCTGCSVEANTGPLVLVFILSFINMLLPLYWLRDSKDPLGVKTELTITALILIVFNLCVNIPANFLLKDVEQSGQWEWPMMTVIEMFILGWYSFIYQVKIARSKDKLSEPTEDIETVLESGEGTKAYALYLAIHLTIENLYFYKAVEKWEKEYFLTTPEERAKSAKDIYCQYVGEDSVFQLNIGSKMENEIKSALFYSETDPIKIDIFKNAKEYCKQYLSGQVFNSFKQSNYYGMYTNCVVFE